MAKKLSDVLAGTNKSRTRPGSTGTRPGVDYASKMKDERDFVAAHDVEEFEDRNGNGSDVFNATNIKHQPDVKHGHVPKPKDEAQYKMNNEESSVMDSSLKPKPRPDSMMASSPRPKKRPSIIGAGAISEPSPNGMSDGSTRGISEENEEKEMMKNQLHFIKYAADEIMGHVNSKDDPEEWFQNKLSGLHAGVRDLHAYIEGDKRMKEEVELDEQTMTFQNAEKLKNKHLVAMDHHKKNGNSKGYAAHSMVVSKFEDAYDRHGTDVIPSGKIIAASQKAFKDHPHSNMKEEAEGDPRVEPKDVKSKGKSLKMIVGAVKESMDVSRTKTGTEQARARFDKKMERKEMKQEQEKDDN